MSITDELREWMKGSTLSSWTAEHLTAIADRIDAEHERAMADAYLSGTPTDEKLTELGWIRLPKDADDEYIQPSDIPRLTKANDGKRLVFCPSLELRQDGTWSLAGWTPDRYRISKPTVEDVLAEFAAKLIERGELTNGGAQTIAEYAKRLTLAEEEDA